MVESQELFTKIIEWRHSAIHKNVKIGKIHFAVKLITINLVSWKSLAQQPHYRKIYFALQPDSNLCNVTTNRLLQYEQGIVRYGT